MLTIKIKTGNAAFDNDQRADRDCQECAAILLAIASRLQRGCRQGDVWDSKGLAVGTYKLTTDERDGMKTDQLPPRPILTGGQGRSPQNVRDSSLVILYCLCGAAGAILGYFAWPFFH